MVRTIDHGKSAEFPRTWKANARYHDPGTPILGSNNIAINPVVISVDDLLISDVFIYDLEDAKKPLRRARHLLQTARRRPRAHLRPETRTHSHKGRESPGQHQRRLRRKPYSPTQPPTPTAKSSQASSSQAAQTLDEKDVPPERALRSYTYIYCRPSTKKTYPRASAT